MKRIFSAEPIFLPQAIAGLRILTGILMVLHGREVFDPDLMNTYAQWDSFKGMPSVLMVYIGKSAELVSGLLLTFGFLTRAGAVMLAITMLYICFFVGQGRFWYQDQHPFMFAMLGILFFFTGPQAWSLDSVIFKRN